MAFNPKHILVIDWETSGAEFGVDVEIIASKYQGISFGAIIADFNTLEEVESVYCEVKFNDAAYIWSPEAEAIHGKSREMLLADGLSSEGAAEVLANLIVRYWGFESLVIFAGHNPYFDIAFTKQLLGPFGVMPKLHHVVLDTSALGMILIGKHRSDDVFDLLGGIQKRKEHNALDDARACLQSMQNAKLIFNEVLAAG